MTRSGLVASQASRQSASTTDRALSSIGWFSSIGARKPFGYQVLPAAWGATMVRSSRGPSPPLEVGREAVGAGAPAVEGEHHRLRPAERRPPHRDRERRVRA
jgi:hypothetical protein